MVVQGLEPGSVPLGLGLRPGLGPTSEVALHAPWRCRLSMFLVWAGRGMGLEDKYTGVEIKGTPPFFVGNMRRPQTQEAWWGLFGA